MKILFTLFTLFIYTHTTTAQQSVGMQWIDNDLEKALNLASGTNKMVFVYCYTTWCGPCKEMKKSVFPKSEAGDFYNNAFVNVKIDLEEGKGPEVAAKYQTEAMPTFLWLSGDGVVVHRSMGGRNLLQFLELGNAALDPDQQITTMHTRYKNGDRSPSFLKQYTKVISASEFRGYEPISKEYLETQSNWNTEENMRFLFDYSEANINSDLFRYTLENRAAFVKLLGKDKVESKIDFAAEKDRSASGISRSDADALKIHYSIYYPEEIAYDKAMKVYFRQLMYSPDRLEQEAFKAEIQLYMASTPDQDWNFYNAAAWQLYELTDENHLLQKAADWTRISMSKEQNAHNTDTMAHILYKLKNKDEAKKYAEQSLSIAKRDGVDYSATLQLLEKM